MVYEKCCTSACWVSMSSIVANDSDKVMCGVNSTGNLLLQKWVELAPTSFFKDKLFPKNI